MRPKRLELRGFSSFRDETVIDFGDADMFVISGPTGSGKSSILDGIAFALYGSVPRYGNRGVIAPAITQGKNEAKLRFDFSVGEACYSVVRVVRRTPTGGAKTTDVALERGTEVLTRNERELTEKIQKIVGLTFDQFTKCILLPQGEFAAFLQDDSAARAELLRDLLGFGFFRTLMRRANDKAQNLKNRMQLSETRLSDFAFSTPEALEAAQARLKQVETLIAEIDRRQPELDVIRKSLDLLKEQEAECASRIGKLARLSPPADVVAVSQKLQRALGVEAAAKLGLDAAQKMVEEVQARQGRLPDRKALQDQIGRHETLVAASKKLAEIETSVKRCQAEAVQAKDLLEPAEKEHAQAKQALDHEKSGHAAYAIARNLVAGGPCPVCGNKFLKFPAAVPAALTTLERRERRSSVALEDCQLVLQRVLASAQHFQEEARKQEAELVLLLRAAEGLPTLDELRALLAEFEVTDSAARAAFEGLKVALAEHEGAQAALSQVRVELERGWQIIRSARDGVAIMEPPALPPGDLALAWQTLSDWSEEQSKSLRAQIGAVDAALSRHKEQEGLILTELAAGAEALSIPLKENLRDQCLRLSTSLASSLSALKDGLLKAADLRKECDALKQKIAAVARLAILLKTNNFETWYLNRSFRQLCTTASAILGDLSKGEYSLTVTDKNDFQIIDHFNADETRPVRTLSGGETFLASLSLALALSEQITQSSASGARLESLFLDEGFGALDANILETVASTIEDMGARGRMIGVITHVRELADRLPVRFEVRKGPTGSTVEKVIA